MINETSIEGLISEIFKLRLQIRDLIQQNAKMASVNYHLKKESVSHELSHRQEFKCPDVKMQQQVLNRKHKGLVATCCCSPDGYLLKIVYHDKCKQALFTNSMLTENYVKHVMGEKTISQMKLSGKCPDCPVIC